MSQPVQFTITVSFANDEANGVGGRSTLRTAQLDAMAVAIKTTLDQILVNLALIQRDDGRLADGTVLLSTLASETRAILASTAFVVRGAWAAVTAYSKGNVVLSSGILYVAMVDHISAAVFSSDLAAGYWGQLTATSTATTISFTPTSTISAANVQAAIAEVDSELRAPQEILLQQLFNGL